MLPAAQSIDVRFEDFMAGEAGTIAAIYQLAGQPLDIETQAAMTAFRAEHPRGRFGGVIYDPGVLGLDVAEIADRLSGYRERFVD